MLSAAAHWKSGSRCRADPRQLVRHTARRPPGHQRLAGVRHAVLEFASEVRQATHMAADSDPGTCLWKRSTASSALTTVYPAEICMRNAVRGTTLTAAASTPWPTTSPATSTQPIPRGPTRRTSRRRPRYPRRRPGTRRLMPAPGTTGTDAASSTCCIAVAESRTCGRLRLGRLPGSHSAGDVVHNRPHALALIRPPGGAV